MSFRGPYQFVHGALSPKVDCLSVSVRPSDYTFNPMICDVFAQMYRVLDIVLTKLMCTAHSMVHSNRYNHSIKQQMSQHIYLGRMTGGYDLISMCVV